MKNLAWEKIFEFEKKYKKLHIWEKIFEFEKRL